MSKSRLGRGLEALFNEHDIESVESIDQIKEGENVLSLSVKKLRPNPYQPRKVFDDEKLSELSNSIREHGVLQPIIVKKDVKGYIIIAGERRFRATILAGIEEIPAIVREYSDDLMMQYAIIENLQREDLNPIEEAMSYRMVMQKLSLTQEKLAEKLGKSRTYIANMTRILKLPQFVVDSIENGEISVGHAKILAGIKNEERILELAMIIKEKGISVRELEEILDEEKDPKSSPKLKRKAVNPHIKSLESNLHHYFGTKVSLKDTDGKGQIVIDYLSTDDLNRLLDIMGVEL